MANFVYDAYRNAVVGKTSDYSYNTAVIGSGGTLFSATVFPFFSDDATVAAVSTSVFDSVYATSENPAYASRTYLASVTEGTVATGVIDAADFTFTSTWAVVTSLPSGSPGASLESLILAKFTTSAAASPLLCRFDTATGLPLTPNNADVTVVWNASGIYKF